MKKLSIGLVLVTVAAVLSMPLIMGFIAEHSLRDYIEYANQQTPIIKFDIKEYSKGWLNSNAKIGVKFDLRSKSTGELKVIEIEFNEKVHHGPIIFRKGSKLALAYFESSFVMHDDTKKYLDEVAKFTPSYPRLDSTIVLGFDRQFTADFSVPSFKAISSKNNQEYFEWQGMQGTATMSKEFNKTFGNTEIPGITIVDDKISITIGKMKADYDLMKNDNEIWSGDMRISQGNIIVKGKDNEVFELDKFTLKSVTTLINNFLSYHFNFDMTHALADEKKYGPFKLNFEIKNLDASMISKLQDNVKKANNPNLSNNERQMIIMALLPTLPGIITPMTELTLDADLKLPEGVLESKGYIRIKHNGKKEGPVNIMLLRKELLASLDARFPVKVAHFIAKRNVAEKLGKEQLQHQQLAAMHPDKKQAFKQLSKEAMDKMAETRTVKQLSQLENSGVLKKSGDYYVLKLWLEDGHLKVNGRALN